MGFLANLNKDIQPAVPMTSGQADVFAKLKMMMDDPTSNGFLGGPAALGTTIASKGIPAIKWLTDRVVGGGSMLSGPVSKITQIPVKDIIVRASDHPDAINPTKVTEIQGLLTKRPGSVPAVELQQEGGKYYLKDGRHRFTAASGLGLQSVPAIIAR